MYRDFCGENRLSLKILLFYFAFGGGACGALNLRSGGRDTMWKIAGINGEQVKLKIFAIP